VYVVGHGRLAREGRYMAAVLACGDSSALSHRSAAALLDLRPSSRRVADVTVSGRRARSREGIDVHAAALLRRDVVTVAGIRCTSWARTILDLGAVLAAGDLARAGERSQILRLFDLRALHEVIDRASGHPGAGSLRRALFSYLPEHEELRSRLERRMLRICTDASLPAPVPNAPIELVDGTVVVDFLWPDHALVAETDGWQAHGTRAAFERDRGRDQRLMLAGYRVVRFTWRQVFDRPAEVVGVLSGLLSSGAGSATTRR
jgi:Protein of unknown function (DUF559)